MMEQYDVFISFKNTDKNGRSTRDAAMAEALYRCLRQKGIQAFFSKYSIDESARADYVDAIDNALESATVFVAVGTSREHLASGWVKHEINQFRTMLNEGGVKKRAIVSYRSTDFSPNDLPSGLRCYQSYDDQKSVVRFVETCLQKASGFRNDGEYTTLLYENDTAAQSASDPSSFGDRPGLQIGSILDGRYEILSLIGRGGMSNVYLATDKRLNKRYAVKETRFRDDKDAAVILESLHTEASLIQKLDHPSIPKIYDVIDNSDALIIVMEYVEGDSLNKLLAMSGSLKEKQVLDIAHQLAGILMHLHDRPTPIIYRDMKPANIILQPNGSVSLIDFGTAREYKKYALRDTTCLGTVGFAAPEQFGGMGQTDARTDIYNLGVTLYYLVTGKNPAEPPYEILPIRQVNANLSRGLEYIIQKCVQKDPDARFQSARELLDALDNIKSLGNRALLMALFNPSVPRPKKKAAPKGKPQKKAPAPFAIPGSSSTVVLPKPNTPPAYYQPPVVPVRPNNPPGFVPPPVSPVIAPVPKIATSARLVSSPPAGVYPPTVVPIPNNGPLEPSAPTETLIVPTPPVAAPVAAEPEQAPSSPENAKPTAKKVTVRPKVSRNTDAETEALITKLAALDTRQKQLVLDLIDQLSK